MLKLIICFVIANIEKKNGVTLSIIQKSCVFLQHFKMYEHSHYKTTA